MKKKTVTFLLHNEQQLVAKDTENANNGTLAFNDFIGEKIAKVITEDGDVYYVPFHAVIWVKVEVEEVEVEPAEDANCNYAGC